ncbi:hypothetical protein DBR44_03880 [Aquitalea sp. FJL05]|nr:hypothetical protein DBR44_03880 [Aquitalea sp. FJL05]
MAISIHIAIGIKRTISGDTQCFKGRTEIYKRLNTPAASTKSSQRFVDMRLKLCMVASYQAVSISFRKMIYTIACDIKPPAISLQHCIFPMRMDVKLYHVTQSVQFGDLGGNCLVLSLERVRAVQIGTHGTQHARIYKKGKPDTILFTQAYQSCCR